MLAIRNSSKVPDKLIHEVLDYLKPFFHKKVFKKLELHFSDEKSKEYSDVISGYAYPFNPSREIPGFKKIKKKSKYFILLDIGVKIKYPYRWVYRKSAQPPFFKNKKEDLIGVLSHELFHIECWTLKKKIYHEEVFAERISRSIVMEYRKRAIKK